MFLRARVQRELTMCANRVLVFLCLAGQLHTFRERISLASAHLHRTQVGPGIRAHLCSRLGRLHLARPRMRSVGRRLFAIIQKDAEIRIGKRDTLNLERLFQFHHDGVMARPIRKKNGLAGQIASKDGTQCDPGQRECGGEVCHAAIVGQAGGSRVSGFPFGAQANRQCLCRRLAFGTSDVNQQRGFCHARSHHQRWHGH